MNEIVMRDTLRDWMTEIGITPVERSDAKTKTRAEAAAARTDYKEDAYDRAITFAEKRLGIVFPTTVADHDILLEYAAKLWLCNRVLAREVGTFDVDDKKLSGIFKNVTAQRGILDQEFVMLRKEIWGEGKRISRSGIDTIEMSVVALRSPQQNAIDNEEVLEL